MKNRVLVESICEKYDLKESIADVTTKANIMNIIYTMDEKTFEQYQNGHICGKDECDMPPCKKCGYFNCIGNKKCQDCGTLDRD